MISEEPPVDYWIDETPPIKGDVEQARVTPEEVFKYFADVFARIKGTFSLEQELIFKLCAPLDRSNDSPSDPTKKSYPTSELVNKSRRTRRR